MPERECDQLNQQEGESEQRPAALVPPHPKPDEPAYPKMRGCLEPLSLHASDSRQREDQRHDRRTDENAVG